MSCTVSRRLLNGALEAFPPTAARVRCAMWSREEEVDPVGTAGFAETVLAVELPLPWPARIDESPGLIDLFAAITRDTVQVQAVVPPEPSTSVRLTAYRAATGPGYQQFEVTVTPSEIASAAAELLGRALTDVHLPPEKAGTPLDVLVCGHGRRDRCCGSLGTHLAVSLGAGKGAPGTCRVRRTSHTGGHRFAPTGIVFPAGTVWGYLDDQTISAVVARTGDVSSVLGHYRGYLRLPSPPLQAVEREVLGVVGWSLFDAARWGEKVSDNRYRLHASWPTGLVRTWYGQVRTGRTLPVPLCGAPIGEATKQQDELVVDEIVEDD